MGLQGMKSLRRKIQGMKDDLDEVDEDLVDDAQSVANTARAHVQNGGQFWKGHLFGAFVVRKRGNRITIENQAPYAAYVEYGTGARGRATDPWPEHVQYSAPGLGPDGEPPDALIANIQAWVRKPNFYPKTPDLPRSVIGFAIAHTIARKGTKAHPFMRPAWHEQRHKVIESAEQSVRHAVRRN